MNKYRRTKLSDTIALLYRAISYLENIYEEEQNAFDNMPESIQESERGEIMESTISVIEDATEQISEAMSSLEELI